jgi:hypothetical protein
MLHAAARFAAMLQRLAASWAMPVDSTELFGLVRSACQSARQSRAQPAVSSKVRRRSSGPGTCSRDVSVRIRKQARLAFVDP